MPASTGTTPGSCLLANCSRLEHGRMGDSLGVVSLAEVHVPIYLSPMDSLKLMDASLLAWHFASTRWK